MVKRFVLVPILDIHPAHVEEARWFKIRSIACLEEACTVNIKKDI